MTLNDPFIMTPEEVDEIVARVTAREAEAEAEVSQHPFNRTQRRVALRALQLLRRIATTHDLAELTHLSRLAANEAECTPELVDEVVLHLKLCSAFDLAAAELLALHLWQEAEDAREFENEDL